MAKNNLLAEDAEYTGKQEEESPILVAQRYLNLFHQTHIFSDAQKQDFNQSLLEMPAKIKEIMLNIPGGKILLEYIKDLEEANNLSSQDISALLNSAASQTGQTLAPLSTSGELTANQIPAGTISISSDFAKSLADSLATAFKNNNLAPHTNIDELSTILSKSFDAYAHNMQQITQNVLSQNLQEFTEVQNRLQEQFRSIQMTTETALAQNMQKTTDQQVQPTSSPAAQLNTQNNNTNSTTINNINIDSSSFNGLTQTIKESETQRHEDFKQIIEALNKSFALKNNQEISIKAITDSITEALRNSLIVSNQDKDFHIKSLTSSITNALRENGKQQLEAIKAFGETLTQNILLSQKEFAATLSKNRHAEKSYIPTPVPTIETQSKTADSEDKITQMINEKVTDNETAERSSTDKQAVKKVDKKEKDTLKDIPASLPAAKDSQPETSSVESKKKKKKKKKKNKETLSPEDIMLNNEDDDSSFNIDNILPKNADTTNDIDDFPIDIDEQNQDLSINVDDLPDIDKNTDDIDFPELNENSPIDIKEDGSFPIDDLSTEDNPEQIQTSDRKATPKAKISGRLNSKFNQLKDAFNEDSDTFLDKFENGPIVDLSDDLAVDDSSATKQQEPEQEDENFEDIPFEDAFISFEKDLSDSDNPPSEETTDFTSDTDIDDAQEWEYVDEDGNPVNPDDNQEWEYVDEDGNPVNPDDAQEWEYVDEDGNPVNPDDAQEWEYVDEDGNPVNPDDAQEWEYVDEDGNPIENNNIENEQWDKK